MNDAVKIRSGAEVRKLARTGVFTGQTAGQAPDHLQANVVILPVEHAPDFLQFCLNNGSAPQQAALSFPAFVDKRMNLRCALVC